jgi:hypothetical protein
MPRIPIMNKGKGPSQKNGDQCGGNSMLARPLPVFYMSDYSVLGLRVDRLAETIRVLEQAGFSVINEAGDIEIVLDYAGHLEGIVQLIKKNGIECELADVVSCVYQG